MQCRTQLLLFDSAASQFGRPGALRGRTYCAARSRHCSALRRAYYYTYSYSKGDDYKQTNIAGTSTYFQAGNTASTYDVNGHLVQVVDSAAGRTRSFINDASGAILTKTDNGTVTNQYYGNGKNLGSVTSNAATPAGASADFDFNYTPISNAYPSVTPGNYIVNTGDTLRGIAYRVYGDPKLWYLIADANGLAMDADLQAGQSLKVPNRVSNLHNDFETNKPYNASGIIGDLTPTLPDPPPVYSGGGGGGGGDCGGFGQILMIVVAIAVAIVAGPEILAAIAPEATANAALLSGFLEAGSVSAASLATTGELFAAGALTGGLSNLAGQVAGNIAGVQDGINFAGIAGAALGGGLGSALFGTIPGVDGSSVNAPLGGLDSVTRAALGSVINQGANILVGAQKDFSWASVAGATVGAAVGNAISDNFQNKLNASGAAGLDPRNLLAQAASNFTGGVTKALLAGGKVNFASIAADTFGNALGTALAYGGFSNASQSERGLGSVNQKVAEADQNGQTLTAGQGVSSVTLSDATEQRVRSRETMLDSGDPFATGGNGDVTADTTQGLRKSGFGSTPGAAATAPIYRSADGTPYTKLPQYPDVFFGPDGSPTIFSGAGPQLVAGGATVAQDTSVGLGSRAQSPAEASIPGGIQQLVDGVIADASKQREFEARIAKYGEWKETPYNFARDNFIGRTTLGAIGDLYAVTVGRLTRDDGLVYNPISNSFLTPREAQDTAILGLTSFVPIGRAAGALGMVEKGVARSVAEEGVQIADQIAARRATAKSFYEASGVPADKIASHLEGIDFSKSVEVVTLPKGTLVDRYQEARTAVGRYFSPVGTPAEMRGMEVNGQQVLRVFEVRENVQVLKSTAANMLDWRGSGKIFNGGGTQYFAPNQTKIVGARGQ